MIQGYDPRTGEPAGDPVPETTDAEVDAIALAAAAASVSWEHAGPAGRAAALEAVAAALDRSAGPPGSCATSPPSWPMAGMPMPWPARAATACRACAE